MRISIAKKSKFSYKNYRLRTWTLKLLLMKQFQVCSQGCSNVNKVVRDFFHQSHRKEMQKQGRILFLTGSAQWMKDSCYPISVIIEIHDFTSFLKDFQPSWTPEVQTWLRKRSRLLVKRNLYLLTRPWIKKRIFAKVKNVRCVRAVKRTVWDEGEKGKRDCLARTRCEACRLRARISRQRFALCKTDFEEAWRLLSSRINMHD